MGTLFTWFAILFVLGKVAGWVIKHDTDNCLVSRTIVITVAGAALLALAYAFVFGLIDILRY